MIQRLLKLGDIGRRYFVVNSFDGVLTVLGIVMGSLISQVRNPLVPLNAGIGASLALGISGFSSAYLSEKAEREKDLEELEGKMLKKLKGSLQERKLKRIPLKISIVNGFSPFLTGLVCILPFAVSSSGKISIDVAYLSSIGIALGALLFLGYFLGRIGRKNRLLSALKMLGVGIVTVVVLYLLGLGGF